MNMDEKMDTNEEMDTEEEEFETFEDVACRLGLPFEMVEDALDQDLTGEKMELYTQNMHHWYANVEQAVVLAVSRGDRHYLENFFSSSRFDSRRYLMVTNPTGNTLLHEAVNNGDVYLTWFLLERGSDPLFKNNDGLTPSELGKLSLHKERLLCSKLCDDHTANLLTERLENTSL